MRNTSVMDFSPFINCVPVALTKGQSASPARALASLVFPLPGGPYISMPLDISWPDFLYITGSLMNFTKRLNSSFAASPPTTESKLSLLNFSSSTKSSCAFVSMLRTRRKSCSLTVITASSSVLSIMLPLSNSRAFPLELSNASLPFRNIS